MRESIGDCGQLPGGWLLDRLGSQQVYLSGLLVWCALTTLKGGVWMIGTTAAAVALFVLRFLVGLNRGQGRQGRTASVWKLSRE